MASKYCGFKNVLQQRVYEKFKLGLHAKMEYVTKVDIFCLKMTERSGLEKIMF